MAQTVDYLGFFSSDIYGPAIYWNPGKDLRLGKAAAQLYGAFGFVEQMRIQSATGNVGIGTMTPAAKLDVNGNINFTGSVLYQGSPVLQSSGMFIQNTSLGISALESNSGTGNTAIGFQALSEATGSDNTAIGDSALSSNTGNFNTATGVLALEGNASGSSNTATGYFALQNNFSGSNNTAVGYESLQSGGIFSGGSGNTAIGSQALLTNTGASNNTAIGYNALRANTSGGSNVAIGSSALTSVVSGGNNVAIGPSAGSAFVTDESNNIDISNEGTVGDSNTIRIGNDTQFSFYAGGIYNKTSSGGVPVLINSSGQMGTMASSRRYKEDIQDMGDASRGLMDLRPVTFRYKKAAEDGSKPLQYGLIAEEVAEVYPDLVVYNKEGLPDAVQYQNVNAMLLNEVQRQKAEIRRLEDRLAKLETALASISAASAAAGAAPILP